VLSSAAAADMSVNDRMKLGELLDTVVSDMTQHCLMITHEQHQRLGKWHWYVVVVVVGATAAAAAAAAE